MRVRPGQWPRSRWRKPRRPDSGGSCLPGRGHLVHSFVRPAATRGHPSPVTVAAAPPAPSMKEVPPAARAETSPEHSTAQPSPAPPEADASTLAVLPDSTASASESVTTSSNAASDVDLPTTLGAACLHRGDRCRAHRRTHSTAATTTAGVRHHCKPMPLLRPRPVAEETSAPAGVCPAWRRVGPFRGPVF
jgi:hypothetical protein